MADSRKNAKSKRNAPKENGKRTEVEAKMSVKVNGREVEHPVRKFLMAVGMILLPLVGGSTIALLTINAQEAFSSFKQPVLAPPAWLFPVMWTILYIMMGVASYLIYRSRLNDTVNKKLWVSELILFYVQLVFNYVWSLLFFNADLKFFAFGWLVTMWLMSVALVVLCWRNCRAAMWLLLPYPLWCTFAGYLNIAIAMLN